MAVALAVAAGLNPYVAVGLVGSLAAFSQRVTLVPEFAFLRDGGTLALCAILLGVDLVFGKLPSIGKYLQRAGLPLRVLGGAALFAAVPHGLSLGDGSDKAVALAAGALLAGGVAALLLGAHRALAGKFRGFEAVLIGLIANICTAILVPLALLAPIASVVLVTVALTTIAWGLVDARRTAAAPAPASADAAGAAGVAGIASVTGSAADPA